MNQPAAAPKILIAPLDWGLGHATRCVPVIKELIAQGCNVVIAASGKPKALLQQEFPLLSFLPLPGYNIQYSASAWGLPFKIVAQIPKLFSAIKKEKKWLKKIVEEEKIDAVISDNRYGFHHPQVKSILITHQLRIKAPLQSIEIFLQQMAYRYIDQFDECWVPDEEGENNLAGALSHPKKKPSIPLRYIGPLSRFEINNGENVNDHLLILLSGPEPQRSLLEDLLLNELKTFTKPVVFVRGLPDTTQSLQTAENITVYNHLPAAELAQKIREAFLVISRCGYSTVMDLAAMKKRSVLIPTPGQTEQEYLAKHLMQLNFALCVTQKKFRLNTALRLAEKFPYQSNFLSQKNLKPTIKAFVKDLQSNKVEQNRLPETLKP